MHLCGLYISPLTASVFAIEKVNLKWGGGAKKTKGKKSGHNALKSVHNRRLNKKNLVITMDECRSNISQAKFGKLSLKVTINDK